jgi:hypothetical protein
MFSLSQVGKGGAHPAQLKVSDYTLGAVTEAEEALQKVQTMSDAEAEASARAEFEENTDRAARMTHAALARRARYTAMLDKVKTWRPPTEAHTVLRDGIISELESGLRWECAIIPPPKLKTLQEYKAWRIGLAYSSLEYAKKTLVLEQKRVEADQAWIDALHESVEREVEFERALAGVGR